MGYTFATCSSSHGHKPYTISVCTLGMLLQVHDVNRDHQAIFQAVSEMLYNVILLQQVWWCFVPCALMYCLPVMPEVHSGIAHAIAS